MFFSGCVFHITRSSEATGRVLSSFEKLLSHFNIQSLNEQKQLAARSKSWTITRMVYFFPGILFFFFVFILIPAPEGTVSTGEGMEWCESWYLEGLKYCQFYARGDRPFNLTAFKVTVARVTGAARKITRELERPAGGFLSSPRVWHFYSRALRALLVRDPTSPPRFKVHFNTKIYLGYTLSKI